MIGAGESAIGRLVERSTRPTLLAHLPRLEDWAEKPPAKNDPSLRGYGAVAVNACPKRSMMKLAGQLRKTLAWDRGKELSGHAQFAVDTGTRVCFADSHSHSITAPAQPRLEDRCRGLRRTTMRVTAVRRFNDRLNSPNKPWSRAPSPLTRLTWPDHPSQLRAPILESDC